ncbi:MAG: hypothetical protein IKJ36_00950 [Clostridia bacterium]|nr:hypothetical protein [Clostridia bacterium]
MKIIYIVKSRLHFYPPCVSQIRMIKDLGFDIDVLYGTCDDNTLKLLEEENINTIKVSNIKEEYFGKLNKLIGWLKFRLDLKKYLSKNYNKEDILWFGNAETVIPMKFLLKGKKYIVSLLELLDEAPLKRFLLHGILENARRVTCCEETRAYIIKYWYSLKYLPDVLPNKAYKQITQKCIEPSNIITKKIIDEIKGEDIIIYQGYLQNTEELLEIAYALKMCKKKYKFVLMGIDEYNSYSKIKDIFSNTVFYEYVPAPLHLEITSYARIGILFYRPTILNKAFCAPNKIFEYSGFGIPMIGNDIPGLNNTIGISRAGRCITLERNNVLQIIEEIEENYEEYKNNALKFFDSVNNKDVIEKILIALKEK